MKKLVDAIRKGLGAPAAQAAAPDSASATVPLDAIRYSMPTIAADLPGFDQPTAASAAGAPQFHEDHWRQLEFFSANRLGVVQGVLRELKAFEAANRCDHGWNQIYIRDLPPLPIAGLAPDFGQALSFKPGPAPVLTTSSEPLGQVSGGFSLEIGKNACLYGLQQAGSTTVLGASLQGADNMLLSTAFAGLNRLYGLILVDWMQQLVLVSVDSDGQFEVWRP